MRVKGPEKRKWRTGIITESGETDIPQHNDPPLPTDQYPDLFDANGDMVIADSFISSGNCGDLKDWFAEKFSVTQVSRRCGGRFSSHH